MIRLFRYYPLGPMGYTVWVFGFGQFVLCLSLKYIAISIKGRILALFFWPPGIHVE
jgi:hypothetical protein